MSRFISRWWLCAGLCGTALLGCESGARRPYADDPFLMNRKPLLTSAATASPGPLARTEPPPPTPPITAVASAEEAETAPSVPADVAGTRPPIAALPVARIRPPHELPASPPIRRQVPETYGHAADYTWLQGILDRNYRGQFGLRYCEPSVEDRWGGKVMLIDDSRLAQFHDGDLILVEGELVKDKPAQDTQHRYPAYRIREIWLAQRGK